MYAGEDTEKSTRPGERWPQRHRDTEKSFLSRCDADARVCRLEADARLTAPLCLCVSVAPAALCLPALCVSAACGRRTPPPAAPVPLPPQVSGTLAVDGLTAPVRVVRDRWGVPHIYAGNQDDLFFAQGFVQAQDRLFQMDLWRRSVQGRLSEVLGSNFLERDAMTRRMQYRGDMRAEWASYGPDTEAIATAFVRGVNAWVDIALAQLPEEFTLRGVASGTMDGAGSAESYRRVRGQLECHRRSVACAPDRRRRPPAGGRAAAASGRGADRRAARPRAWRRSVRSSSTRYGASGRRRFSAGWPWR